MTNQKWRCPYCNTDMPIEHAQDCLASRLGCLELKVANENIEQLHDGLNEYAKECERLENRIEALESVARMALLGFEAAKELAENFHQAELEWGFDYAITELRRVLGEDK